VWWGHSNGVDPEYQRGFASDDEAASGRESMPVSDWDLRLAHEASKMLRGEIFWHGQGR
jgi:hypothetical protein